MGRGRGGVTMNIGPQAVPMKTDPLLKVSEIIDLALENKAFTRDITFQLSFKEQTIEESKELLEKWNLIIEVIDNIINEHLKRI